MRRRHSLLLIAPAVLAIVGCGGGGGSTGAATSGAAATSTAAAAPAGGQSTVDISNFKFVPATITVKQGTGITVTNKDTTTHTATADSGGAFDTGDLDPGASKTITLSKAGRFAYHCTIHPFMHGVIVVQ
jgi:plastocyanin